MLQAGGQNECGGKHVESFDQVVISNEISDLQIYLIWFIIKVLILLQDDRALVELVPPHFIEEIEVDAWILVRSLKLREVRLSVLAR